MDPSNRRSHRLLLFFPVAGLALVFFWRSGMPAASTASEPTRPAPARGRTDDARPAPPARPAADGAAPTAARPESSPKGKPPKPTASSDAAPVRYELKQRSYARGFRSIVGITGRKAGRAIAVQVLGNGKPAAGQIVEFRIVGTPSGAKGASLSKTRTLTDGQGRASVQFTVGDKEGQYLVGAYLHGSIRKTEPAVTRVNAMTAGWVAFMIFGLIGGLGLFLYGMGLAGDHLQKAAGEKMRVLIGKLARDRFRGVVLGTVASGVLQSSSAATVMLVGFVSATMMTLTQAISVMMGAKVGVTITVQLIAFNLAQYALAIVGAGAIVIMAAGKKEKLKHVGAILLGFGLIFFGLSIMSGAMKPLRGIPEFTGMLLKVSASPLLAILLGAAFTGIIQSSAATVAICMALATQGLLPLSAAIPLSMGAAIGTCATALLASIGASRDGKRVAVAHLAFSVFSAAAMYPFLGPFTALTRWLTSAMGSHSVTREIANGFMFFTIFTVIVFLPFVASIEKLVRWMIPASKEEVPFGPKYINEAAVQVPLLALDQAQKEVERMASILGEALRASFPAIKNRNADEIRRLMGEDDKLDTLEKAIRPFLARVAQKGFSEEAAARERALIFITGHLEEAGDQLAKQVLHSGMKVARAGQGFSEEGAAELESFHAKMVEKFDRVAAAVRDSDRALAERVVQLSFKETQMARRLRNSHLERLHKGVSGSMESSRAHLAILAGYAAVGAKLDDVADEIMREL